MTQGKRGDTRQRLVDAAFQLFHERGYDKVTVDQIAANAGVSRRTFFRYFRSKEKVVFPYTDARLEHFHSVIRSRTQGGRASFDDLRDVYEQVVRHWIDNKEWMLSSRRIVEQSSALLAYDYEVNGKWERAIGLELDGMSPQPDGDGTPSLRARIAAGMLVGVMRPVFMRWYECNGAMDLIAEGQTALDLAEQGLGSLGLFLRG